jgi:alanine dehydrogenase
MAGTYPAPHRHSSTQRKLWTTIFGEILYTRLGNAADGSRGRSAAGRAGLDDTGRAWLGAGLVQVRAARMAERTEANVPAASTSVAPAVASDAIVAQSVMPIELPEP